MDDAGTVIGEHAVVAFVTAIDDWPAGTKGAVVGEEVDRKVIEIADNRGEWIGDVSAPPEQLRLIRESAGPADIAELDRVALLSTVDGWRPGTTGTVIEVTPNHRAIEIFGYLGETLDFIDVPAEQLRLIRKCPRPDLDFARSRAVEATEERRAPMPIGEHDVVALRTLIEGWPPGTRGTVIHNGPIFKLIEVSDHLGEDLAFLSVPAEQLRVVWRTTHRSSEIGAD